MAKKVRCLTVEPGSSLLADIQDLWRRNSNTLGFFPAGAFEDYACKNRILAAVNEGDLLLGYLAFRCTKRRAVIVHLCVDLKYIGQGIPKILFDEFVKITRDQAKGLLGASVTCRSDFRAAKLWPILGFQLKGSIPARMADKILECWWYDYGRPDLFTTIHTPQLAVIDSNVFFDIIDPSQPHHKESKSLMGDWLGEYFRLVITPELLEEIERSRKKYNRTVGLTFARNFEQTKATTPDASNIFDKVCSLLGLPQKPSERSDFKQLAHAVAAGATHFVTRDGGLLKKRRLLLDIFRIHVLRPAELITLFDMDKRPEAYEPYRLENSNLDIRLLRHDELDSIINIFLSYSQGEIKANLRKAITEAMSHSEHSKVEVVLDVSGQPIGLTVVEKDSGKYSNIRIIRVAPGSLCTILAWHLVWRQVVLAVNMQATVVRLTDSYAPIGIDESLIEIGFTKEGSTWHKVLLKSALSCEEIRSELSRLTELGECQHSTIGTFTNLMDMVLAPRRAVAMHRLEKLVWPAKVKDSSIPNFVVSIEPKWAQQLFDSKAGDSKLFASEANLLLRFENVYYRSGRQHLPSSASRVLWYTKYNPRETRSGCLCAASLVNDVVVGSAKKLFTTYKRYGVFKYKDLLQMPSAQVGQMMAFTFSHTEILPHPISFTEAKTFLYRRTGKSHQFQSPLALEERDWLDLYLMGFPEGKR